MGKTRIVCVAAGMALLSFAPGAAAGRLVSVGYTAPSNLHGLRVVSRISALHVAEVRVPNHRAVVQLRARSGIRFVQRPRARAQTSAPASLDWQWTSTHADLVPSWVSAAASAVKVAVVDTGVDLTAAGLAAKAPMTWNVVTGTGDVQDAIGHGTFVTSLAAEFGGSAQLLVVQANRDGTTFTDVDEAAAITWSVDHGANIVNLSIGGTQTSVVERSAIQYATDHGVLLVAAAGNAAEQGNPVVYPAALLGAGGLVVGASTSTGLRAPFSTTGTYVDVLAPGVGVVGALAAGIPTGGFAPLTTPGYAYGSGTSFAAPEVAGTAALVWAANPSLDAAGVAATIEATASSDGRWTKDLAFGTIDVAAAVARAVAGPAPGVMRPPLAPKPSVAKRVRLRPRP